MNTGGVLGFPLRIAIAVLLVSMCVPSLVYAVDEFDSEADASETSSEARKMIDAAGEVYYEGKGSSRVISVDIPSGCSVELGGEGIDAKTVRVVCDGDVEETIHPMRPGIDFDGECVVTGSREVKFTCVSYQETGFYGVRAEIV